MKVELCVPKSQSSYIWGGMLSQHVGTTVGKHTPSGLFKPLDRSSTVYDQVFSESSFLHECFHYIQDMSTGVGHWDYIHRIAYVDSTIQAYKELKTFPLNKIKEVISLQGDEFVIDVFKYPANHLIIQPEDEANEAKITRISEAIFGDADCDEKYDLSRDLTGAAILEQDAALSTFDYVTSKTTTRERFLKSDNSLRGTWDIFSMPSRYNSIFIEANSVLFPRLEDEDEINHIRASIVFVSWIFDLALAHPSPWLIDERGISREDYEPGVKAARLLRSAYSMSESEFSVIASAIAARDMDSAEQSLLAGCSTYNYIPSRQIYEDWRKWLLHLSNGHAFEGRYSYLNSFWRTETGNIPSAQARVRACEMRLAENQEQYFHIDRHDPLATCSMMDVPILFVNGGEISTTLSRSFILSAEARDAFIVEAFSHSMDMELAHLISTGQTMRCPLARAFTKCDRAQNGNCDGIFDHPNKIPASECVLRSTFEL